jgi:hypothetical protein
MAIILIIALILFCRRWRLDRRTQKALVRIEAKTDFVLGRLGLHYEGN